LTLGKDANVISLAYMPKISPLAPTNCDDYDQYEENVLLTSDVSWETDVPGMALRAVLPQYNPPPGLKYIKSSSGGGSIGGGSSSGSPKGAGPTSFTTTDKPPPSITGKGGDGDEPDPLDNSFFGFFKRYWYVLLPLILSNFLQSEAPTDKKAEGGGDGAEGATTTTGGGGGGGGTPAAGSAASPGQVRQRRGKRG
jgi:hypothetical protein